MKVASLSALVLISVRRRVDLRATTLPEVLGQ